MTGQRDFQRGMFSLIRFAPDRARGEFVNVGVVLVVPEVKFADVQMADQADNIVERFGARAVDRSCFAAAALDFEDAIREASKAWGNDGDIRGFGRKLGNSFIISEPRVMASANPQSDLRKLYERLVHIGRAKRTRAKSPNLVQA